MTEHKLPRSPLRAGLIAFGLTILIGAIVGITAIVALNPGGDMEKRGELFGQGLGTFSMFVGVIAYFIQRKRTNG